MNVHDQPVTTPFPVPHDDDGARHVYLSVGHQQMMTDPMTPFGLSMWQKTAMPVMHEAGGRLFVDAADRLASPAIRAPFLAMVARSDPLFASALQAVVARADLLPPPPSTPPGAPTPARAHDAPASPSAPPSSAPLPTDRAIVTELAQQNEASNAEAARALMWRSGAGLLDAIEADIVELKRRLFDPRSHQVFMSAMEASWWLDEHLLDWLGEKNAADTLTLSVDDNVTSAMGLALLDIADVIRPHPAVVMYLASASDDGFLDGLAAIDGGGAVRDVLAAFLDRYGMRCPGEIDIARPRWCERPSALAPLLLGNVRNTAPGEAQRRFSRGRETAQAKEREVLDRLRALPDDGATKADETKTKIDRVRTFIGYREHPKYFMMGRYLVYRQAVLGEAARLVGDGVLGTTDDVWFLTFDELREVVRTRRADAQLLARRRDEFRAHHALTPPRVITSSGETFDGEHSDAGAGAGALPAGALRGVAASRGVVEGRARVVRDIADVELDAGDILVTAYTDPSWTPLFVTIAGLVTEVGGQMTHGSVVAREFGLPAVVGVANATTLIADGRRIRVDGTDGYVELLD